MSFDGKLAVWVAAITVRDPVRATSASTVQSTRLTANVGGASYIGNSLQQPVAASRTAFDDHSTNGRGRVSVGELVLNNANGQFDYMRSLCWDGGTCTLYLGVTGNQYPDDFTIQSVLKIQNAVFSQDTVTVHLRDAQRATEAVFQTTKFAGTNVLPAGLEGTSDLAGKPKPVLLGTGRNIPAICVNTTKLIYQIHDGAVQSIANVYDKGVALGVAYPLTSRTTPAVPAGSYYFNIADDGTTYVAVGESGTPTSLVMTSPDGITP